ncbi:MAG: class I SAM-dependent methyltransferase, partial [Chloroflexi bacterium]|nr:class I SAM-dependent methyltransferase [Chloroflexota bacterium]
MSFAGKLLETYFDLVYNPVYDFAAARFPRYRELHATCVASLELKDNDRVLCVGLGTGNEALHILQRNRDVNIVGVDFSKTALRKARKKALKWGKEIELLVMDAHQLQFPAESFDKVLCLHVMDFVEDGREVTSEIVRVLKQGGEFVVTYPSAREGLGLGCNLLRDSVSSELGSGKRSVRVLLGFLAQMMVGLVYLPLLLRPKRKSYSRDE